MIKILASALYVFLFISKAYAISEYRTIFQVDSGASYPGSLSGLWLGTSSSDSAIRDGSIIDFWAESDFDHVRVSWIKNNQEVQHIVLDKGTSNTDFFSFAGVRDSSWTDLYSSTNDFMGLTFPSLPSREFVIRKSSYGCAGDTYWALSIATSGSGCAYDQIRPFSTRLLYSSSSTASNIGILSEADFLRMSIPAAVPLPATAWLFCSSSIGLLFTRRYKYFKK